MLNEKYKATADSSQQNKAQWVLNESHHATDWTGLSRGTSSQGDKPYCTEGSSIESIAKAPSLNRLS